MTEIKVNENGQAFFDFDALEKLTSKEFVVFIFDELRKDSSNEVLDIVVEKNQFYVKVYMKSDVKVKIFSFDKNFKWISLNEIFISELKVVFDLFVGDLNG